MDLLSEFLNDVKLESAAACNAEFSSPWSQCSAKSCNVADSAARPGKHAITFHLLLEGHAQLTMDDQCITLGPGDIAFLPHGNSHCIGDRAEIPEYLGTSKLHRIAPSPARGSKEVTHFICGSMICEARLGEAFLLGLPRIFKVNLREDRNGRWFEEALKLGTARTGSGDPGAEAVLTKICETLLVEALRRYFAELPDEQKGWLAAARDPGLGRVLALIHRRPQAPWTIATLANEAGVSRSVLAERFRLFLGEPPVSYLTKRRLQLGAQMLGRTSYSVAQIASEVGYDSEQSFNRAFKREFGDPPARYRNTTKAAVARAM